MIVRRAGSLLLVVALVCASLVAAAGAQSAGVETSGYWMLERDGTVYPFGGARHFGDRAGSGVDAVQIVSTPTGRGYLILDVGGDVHAFGDAPDLGDVSPFQLEDGERVSSISLHPTNRGYWVFTSRGQVFDFGEADDFGDLTTFTLNGPVVGSVATPSGLGYWMVGSDGGVFSFGDAAFAGSMGGTPLNQPVNGLVPDPDGTGYWLVASDGGVFAFDAGFRGSMGSTPLNAPVVGMVAAGDGYIMVGADGGAFVFSNGGFHGSLGSSPPGTPIVDITALDPLAEPAAITLTGTANSFAEECFTADGGIATFDATHDGSSNFAVWLLDAEGDRLELLVNEIGAFDGLGDALRVDGGRHCFEVTADGAWTITVEQPRNEAFASPSSNDGTGNALVGPFPLDGAYQVTATHDGSSNFASRMGRQQRGPSDQHHRVAQRHLRHRRPRHRDLLHPGHRRRRLDTRPRPSRKLTGAGISDSRFVPRACAERAGRARWFRSISHRPRGQVRPVLTRRRSVRWSVSAGEAEEDDDGPAEPNHVVITESTDLLPSFTRGTVVILSTIRLLASRSPLSSSGSTRSLNSGASVGSVVNEHTVIDAVASKRSSF